MKNILKCLVVLLSIQPAIVYTKVNLDFWPYDAEGCVNLRDQFLKNSSTGRVQNSKRYNQDCHVVSGKWADYYTKDVTEDAAEVMVAPIIPLKLIKKYKLNWNFQKYYDYVHDPNTFVLFIKGSDGEKRYNKNMAGLVKGEEHFFSNCEMIGKWMDAKIKHSIPFDEGEKEELTTQGLKCINTTMYSRVKLYGGWSRPPGKECQTRTEVLKLHSLVQATPIPKYKEIKCTPKLKGKWYDYYTGDEYTAAEELDIDHVVPLGEAYRAGTWKWPYWKRQQYANYMTNPFHLLPVSYSENRSKSDNTPENYMPPNEDFRCPYLNTWVNVKFRWGLAIKESEKKFLVKELESCPELDKQENVLAINMLSSENPWSENE